jgi:hypothetical protein
MSDDRSSADVALDLILYVPVGLAYEVLEAMPRLARRGRGQVGMARLVSNAASQRGNSEVQKAAVLLGDVIGSILGGPQDDVITADTDVVTDDLVPDDYDSMSASAIVAILDDLSAAERAAIGRHERSNRCRITVLRRIDQLDGGR